MKLKNHPLFITALKMQRKTILIRILKSLIISHEAKIAKN